jgi:hypothetical protein
MDDRLQLRLAAMLLACASLVAAGGCQTFDLSKNIPWGSGKDGNFARPMKLIAVWQDTVLHHDGAMAVRGFGGRVWFYGADQEKPVEVAGTLEVYAFDETGREATNTVPNRKYVFSAEDVQKHHSSGKLGDSYSFWLPWGDVNEPPVEISLICRFTPDDGSGTIVGEETRHLLPGRELAKQPPKRKGQSAHAATERARAYEPRAYKQPAAAQQPQVQPASVSATGCSSAEGGMVIPTGAFTEANASAPLKPGMQVTTFNISGRIGGGAPYTTNMPAHPSPEGVSVSGNPSAAATPAGTLNQPQQPATGYRPGPRRVLGGPIERLNREHDPRRPNPARWQYGHALQPQGASLLGSNVSGSPVGSAAH